MATRSSDNVTYYEMLADCYDLFFEDLDRNTQQEGECLDRTLAPYGARLVLDACCGTGRQALPLAEAGYTVTAADPSAAMLHRASEAAGRRDLPITFVKAPFAELPSLVHAQFDAVIALGNGLCHLVRLAEIQQALTALRQCCRSGGICLVGTKDFDEIGREHPRFHGHQIVESDGQRTILFEVWDYDDPILTSTAFLLLSRQSGETQTRLSTETHEYMLRRGQIETLARNAGFVDVSLVSHPSERVYALIA